jgi:tetratricopeptide (TPR) repeat protein
LGTWKKPKPNPNIERCKENLTLAQQNYPDDPLVYHLWGRVYALEDNYEEMAKAFDKSNELSDQYAAANDTIRMEKWGVIHKDGLDKYQAQDYNGTLEAMKNAIVCWPHHYDPYLFAADASYRIGDSEAAYNYSKQAYEMAPDTMQVAVQFAEMCLQNAKFDEAKTVFETLHQKDPTNARYLFSLSDLAIAENDTAKSIEYALQALEIDKDNADGWLNMVKLYFMLQKYCEAAEAYEHYIPLVEEPNSDDHFLYTLSLYQCEENEKAKTELEKLTIENPENCDAWQLLSNTYLRLKMKNEAIEANKKYENCTK